MQPSGRGLQTLIGLFARHRRPRRGFARSRPCARPRSPAGCDPSIRSIAAQALRLRRPLQSSADNSRRALLASPACLRPLCATTHRPLARPRHSGGPDACGFLPSLLARAPRRGAPRRSTLLCKIRALVCFVRRVHCVLSLCLCVVFFWRDLWCEGEIRV